MNVSFRWLRELVPGLDPDPAAVAADLSLLAAAVEGIENVGGGLGGIRVARVLDVEKHPDADRLSLCRVDTGEGDPLDVVCGAPVIVPGALYPYVGVGETLPGGLEIERREIRGQVSNGMLCSEIELELGRDKSGIMRLADGLEVGAPLAESLGLPDARLSLDLNPNRVDLACHLGVARELAPALDAIEERAFGGSGWTPEWHDGEAEASGAGVTIRIESPERCPRYLAAVVRGVRVGPSPAWLVGRLLAAGSRPINNIVDATNYVLLERNQPLHAFDLATIPDGQIRVRAGRPGERLTTLDGREHELDASLTVIADADRPVAFAGVMGGLDTEVTAGTTDVLIECALFDPGHTRATARGAALSTDASYRFERGVDPTGQEAALRRCVELILAIAGGEADPVGVRAGPEPAAPPRLPLRPARVRQVLGLSLGRDEIAGLLDPIGLTVSGDGDRLEVDVPGWRGDVEREIDLVEEVARRYGFERFPHEPRAFRPSAVPATPGVERARRVRDLLTARGLYEARSLTFVPEEYRGHRSEVVIPNPLSAEESALRSALVPALLRRLELNFARGRRDVRLFEVGTVFRYAEDPAGPDPKSPGIERFAEAGRVGLILTGGRTPSHWSDGGEAPDVDLWDLKGLAEEIATTLVGGIVVPGAPPGAGRFRPVTWISDASFRIERDGEAVGWAGAVRPASVDAPPWAGPVYALELELDAVALGRTLAYEPASAYPAVRRDLSVLVPAGAGAADIEGVLREVASGLLESVRLFDVYEGDNGDGGRSLGWAFRFRAVDRTLTDDEVEREMAAIRAALEERFDARIRTS